MGQQRYVHFFSLELKETVNRDHSRGSAIALGMRLVDWI